MRNAFADLKSAICGVLGNVPEESRLDQLARMVALLDAASQQRGRSLIYGARREPYLSEIVGRALSLGEAERGAS